MKKAALNSNQLKLIAIAAMTLDHLVWTICPGYSRVWWVDSLRRSACVFRTVRLFCVCHILTSFLYFFCCLV